MSSQTRRLPALAAIVVGAVACAALPAQAQYGSYYRHHYYHPAPQYQHWPHAPYHGYGQTYGWNGGLTGDCYIDSLRGRVCSFR
jgi:hypothetical protein